MRRAIQTYLLFIQSQHDTDVIMHSINKVVAASHCSVFGQQNSTRVCNYDLILHRTLIISSNYSNTNVLPVHPGPTRYPFHDIFNADRVVIAIEVYLDITAMIKVKLRPHTALKTTDTCSSSSAHAHSNKYKRTACLFSANRPPV